MTAPAVSAVLALRPDWAVPVRVSYGWRTSVSRLDTGAERRAILKSWPTRKLSLTYTALSAAHARYLDRFIYTHQHQVIGVPVWPGRTELTAEAAAAQTALSITEGLSTGFFVADGCIVLDPDEDPADSTSYEIGMVATVTDTELTLVDDLAATWPVGCEVYPLLACRLPRGVTAAIHNRSAMTIALELTEALLEVPVIVPPVI